MYTKELELGQDVAYENKIWTVRAKVKNTITGAVTYTVESLSLHQTKTLVQDPAYKGDVYEDSYIEAQ